MAHRRRAGRSPRIPASRPPKAEGSTRGAQERPSGPKLTLFGRWLLVVYIPLGLLTLGFLLLIVGTLSGAAVWLLVILGAYCVVPVRLLLEWRRRGLPLPTPRGTAAPRTSRPVAQARTPPPPPPAKVSRLTASQRAIAGIGAIAALLLVGGILLVIGMGRLDSSLGLLLAAIGGFLMILSVTVPTFRLFDIVLRAAGRLIGRRAGLTVPSAQQRGGRSHPRGRPTPGGTSRTRPPAAPRTRTGEDSRRVIPPEL